MKLMHLSDLHLGKRLNGFFLLEDQQNILDQILHIADARKPDCVLIAGDIYDRPVPPAEAVTVLDSFLNALAERELPVLLISGNHDSAERLAYGGRIMQKSGVYLSPVYDGTVEPVTLTDAYGEVRFYLLPFLRPGDVRSRFPETVIGSYQDAVRTAIDAMHIDTSVRNVLITHQFVTGAQQGGSEEIIVGTAESISADVFAGIDYTALGHLHLPQTIGSSIRYCGTPLKYDFEECGQEKSVTFVTLGEKGTAPVIETVPLTPKRDMQILRGRFDELMEMERSDNYIKAILTDEDEIPDAIGKLRTHFKNIMMLDYDNMRTNAEPVLRAVSQRQKTPIELFNDFYEAFNGQGLSDEQRDILAPLIKEIWEGEA
ncbi:MAG: exonuclease SbcCD subunit D [Oscillospiraceae bacterium]|nr:exonuclease SbcCD subunit D [Oscillospiraceae bacterium]